MASIPLISELTAAAKEIPAALKEVPAKQAKARAEVLQSIYDLCEAVNQALNVVTVHCGELIIARQDLKAFRAALLHSPRLLDKFRLSGVCAALGKVRSELRTILNLKPWSFRLFQKRRLESLLTYIQYKERDLEEDFDTFFRELSRRASWIQRKDVAEVVQYLRDCQMAFEEDARTIRNLMREMENHF